MNTETCEKCGRVYAVGDWPYCPHQPFRADQLAVVDDTVDWTIENMTREPLHFTSKTEWKRKMRELGLVNQVRHVDGDRHVTRWV